MSISPLVSPGWLETRLDDASLRIIEISAAKTRDVYATGHIPGAQWWYWKDLCWHSTAPASNGRRKVGR